MLTAEKMNRVSVLILKQDLDGVIEEIARLGILHPARIEEIDEWANDLASVNVEQTAAEYAKRQRRLRQLLEGIAARDISFQAAPTVEIRRLTLNEIDSVLDGIEARLQPLVSARTSLIERKNELKVLLGQLDTLLPEGVFLRDLMQSTFLSSKIGRIHESQLPVLKRLLSLVPSVVFPYRITGENFQVACVVLRRDKATLESCLSKVGFNEAELPQDLRQISVEVETAAARELADLDIELSRVAKDIEHEQSSILPELQAALFNVEAGLLLLRVKNYCKSTDTTCLFSGWAPQEKTGELVAAMREKTQGKAIVDVVAAETVENQANGGVEVPVLVNLPLFLKPFRILVEGFGIPSYRMIDPTIFVAVTFLIMFGMMFGDIGHGIVLAAAGILVACKSKEFRDIGKLMIYGGASSVTFGILYGSVFGLDTLIPPLWLRPLDNITTLFVAAIGFGVVMVSLGLILNMINAVRMHTFAQNVFDESGLLIAIAYWAGIGVTVKFLLFTEGPLRPGAAFAIVALPLALFFAKGPILRFAGKQKKAFPEGVPTYLIEGLVEIMEVLMGYLANTVSFIRVAAFGLAHSGLFVAIFGIADAVSGGPGGRVSSWAVLIAGNIIVIVLEGLVVTIQALRLEYYEFFGKFFKSGGAKYNPVAFSSVMSERTS